MKKWGWSFHRNRNIFSLNIAWLKVCYQRLKKPKNSIRKQRKHTEQSLDPLNCDIQISCDLNEFILTILLWKWANNLCFKNEELGGKKLRLWSSEVFKHLVTLVSHKAALTRNRSLFPSSISLVTALMLSLRVGGPNWIL